VTHRITIAERRARLAVRHHIAPTERVESMVHAARDLVCLHATDPATVYLSAWARMTHPAIELVDRALYHDRSLVRMLAYRVTSYVVTASVRTSRTLRARATESYGLLMKATSDCSAASVSRSVG
jgi:hypothetical protein